MQMVSLLENQFSMLTTSKMFFILNEVLERPMQTYSGQEGVIERTNQSTENIQC